MTPPFLQPSSLKTLKSCLTLPLVINFYVGHHVLLFHLLRKLYPLLLPFHSHCDQPSSVPISPPHASKLFQWFPISFLCLWSLFSPHWQTDFSPTPLMHFSKPTLAAVYQTSPACDVIFLYLTSCDYFSAQNRDTGTIHTLRSQLHAWNIRGPSGTVHLCLRIGFTYLTKNVLTFLCGSDCHWIHVFLWL